MKRDRDLVRKAPHSDLPMPGLPVTTPDPVESPGGSVSRELLAAVQDALGAVREPDRAAGQQRYMKSAMPFQGVRTPVMRRAARAVFDRLPPASAAAWQATILALWREAGYREQRYAAIELAVHRPFLRWMTMDAVPMLDEIIVEGAWWDYVDRIAPAGLGHLLVSQPQPMGALMRTWARDEDIWRRRAALLCQLGRKEDTDSALLYDCLEACFGHDEFFVRKAMGWALRAYARVDPAGVRRFVGSHEASLSKLTRREALKHIGFTQ